MTKFKLLFVVLCMVSLSCKKEDKSISTPVFNTEDLNSANSVLLESVMEDAFTPPVASRIYAYSHLAHYITLQSVDQDQLIEITSKLNGLDNFEVPEIKDIDARLSALLSFSAIGKNLFIQSSSS